jgi:hypothetical protein
MAAKKKANKSYKKAKAKVGGFFQNVKSNVKGATSKNKK